MRQKGEISSSDSVAESLEFTRIPESATESDIKSGYQSWISESDTRVGYQRHVPETDTAVRYQIRIPESDTRVGYCSQITESDTTMPSDIHSRILLLSVFIAIALQIVLCQDVTEPVDGDFECYVCSSQDTEACGGDFQPDLLEAKHVTSCGGYCYKSTFDYFGVRHVSRGCEPSSDCPRTCFGNDCPYCCRDSLCNRATTTMSSMTSLVFFASLCSALTAAANYIVLL